MEAILDTVWEYLYGAILQAGTTLDTGLTPLRDLLGPAAMLVLLAASTVALTKFLGRHCKTKRLLSLEKEFYHWLDVRDEAMRCKDRDKGARMARNIDQAKLNRCYYDYFLEGLLLSLASMYLPILAVLSYINTFYHPERLMAQSGKTYILIFSRAGAPPLAIGSVFFYLFCLISCYAGWAFLKKAWAWQRRREVIREINGSEGSLSQHAARFSLREEL